MIPCAILCGGLGTRLAPLTDFRPKSLIEVARKPFILHQFDMLRAGGVTDAVLCIGHYGGDIARATNMGYPAPNLRYSYDGSEQLGTAGALRNALPILGDEFFVLYGDSYLPGVDYRAVYEAFKTSGKPALMTVKRNDDLKHRNNVLYRNSLVSYYNKNTPDISMDHIDYGLTILTPKAIGTSARNSFNDLADVYWQLALWDWLAAYEVTTPMLGIGNHESLVEMQAYMEKQKT